MLHAENILYQPGPGIAGVRQGRRHLPRRVPADLRWGGGGLQGGV